MSVNEDRSRQPSSCDLLIARGRLLDLDTDSGVVDGAAIAVRDGLIAAVGPREEIEAAWLPQRRISADGQVVTSGFVDAHVHLAAVALTAGRPYQRPTGPNPFSGAKNIALILELVAKMCAEPIPVELVARAAKPVLAAMLLSGTTAFVDAGGPSSEGVAIAAAELGIRAVAGPSLADQWYDETGELVRQADADTLLADAESVIQRIEKIGVRALVSAVATLACSDELLAGIASLTRKYGLPTHVHSHVSDADVAAHEAAYGRTATERLGQAGMLRPDSMLMHAGAVSDDDIAVLAGVGTVVNHNPWGNAMFGFGTTAARSVPRLLAAGVPVVLGSDYANRINSPFDNIRAALLLHRDHAASAEALGLEQAIAMASRTTSGQPVRVAAGQPADLVLIDVTGLHHLGEDHPVPVVALHAHADDVRTVIVNGRVVVDDHQLVGVDMAELANWRSTIGG
jgi:5-methylthioadenosine/S-adenosylhomocysteine deaminase